ncbi:MAG: hypothetical protein JJT94_00630 [Bernardetiaceae bacterium]|nr:hypothetical protein [Bernardetiaceae bacterium]
MFKRNNQYEEDSNSFWISYTDLVTGFLIIFIIISLALSQRSENTNTTLIFYEDNLAKLQDTLNAYTSNLDSLNTVISITKPEHDRIKAIHEAMNLLEKSQYFTYNENCHRYELNLEFLFAPLKYNIPSSQKPALKKAGENLDAIVKQMLKIDNVAVQIIIEGRAAREKPKPNITEGAARLSFNRALEIQKFWESQNLGFTKNSKIDVFAAGSGFEGNCRYEWQVEAKNKNFIVHIVPFLQQQNKSQ